MDRRSRVRRLLEQTLPWYDVEQAVRLHERTAAVARQSKAARLIARRAYVTAMRDSFAEAQRRLEGR